MSRFIVTGVRLYRISSKRWIVKNKNKILVGVSQKKIVLNTNFWRQSSSGIKGAMCVWKRSSTDLQAVCPSTTIWLSASTRPSSTAGRQGTRSANHIHLLWLAALLVRRAHLWYHQRYHRVYLATYHRYTAVVPPGRHGDDRWYVRTMMPWYTIRYYRDRSVFGTYYYCLDPAVPLRGTDYYGERTHNIGRRNA